MENNSYKYDVIAIGDSTLDTFLQVDEANVLCNINKDMCWLCLNYADKIPVTKLDHSLGGNACNLAVGSARLGLKSAIYTVISDDDTGKRISEQFKKENVASDYVKIIAGSSSNYSVILNFQTERTILAYHQKVEYKLPELPAAKFLYVTSMTEGCEVIYPAIIDYINKNSVKLCFGPGSYQKRSGFSKNKELIANSFLFISNKEEAESIFDWHRNGESSEKFYLKNLLYKIRQSGPKIVVVTDGNNGAFAYDGENYYHAETIDVPVVEKTGAGDSFSTGLIAGFTSGEELLESLKWGIFNSASVIGEIGAQKGLLTRDGLNNFQKRFSNYKVNQI